MKENSFTTLKIGNLNIEVFDLYNLIIAKHLETISHQHYHYEMHFILNGSITMKINEKNYEIGSNSYYIIPQNLSHSCIAQSSDLQCCVFSFNFANNNRSQKKFEYGYFTDLFKNNALKILPISKYERILIANIYKNSKNFSIYGINKINIETTNLFLEISNDLYKSTKKPLDYGIYIPTNDQNEFRKYKIEYYINLKKNTLPTIENLANYLMLSVRQTSRFINENFGKNYKALLSEVKMEAANTLISANEQSLEEIAFQLGYKSYKGFLTAYKKYYGHMPENEKPNNDKDKQL